MPCDEADRHKRCACHERCVRVPALPYTVAADGALREDHDRLSCSERPQHPRDSKVVGAATLIPIAPSPSSAHAIHTRGFTAFLEVPKKRVTGRCGLIHLKNRSTCRRRRYEYELG